MIAMSTFVHLRPDFLLVDSWIIKLPGYETAIDLLVIVSQ